MFFWRRLLPNHVCGKALQMKHVIRSSILPLKQQELSPAPERHRLCPCALLSVLATSSCTDKHNLPVHVYSTQEKKLCCSVAPPRTATQSEQVTLLPSRNNSADFRKITARINLALHNKNEKFIAAEESSVPYLFWVDIKHQGTNIQYGLLFLFFFLMPVTAKK